MLLAIDCGNTQTVIGLFGSQDLQPPDSDGKSDDLIDHWRIVTVASLPFTLSCRIFASTEIDFGRLMRSLRSFSHAEREPLGTSKSGA